MKILQFGFENINDNDFLPHNFIKTVYAIQELTTTIQPLDGTQRYMRLPRISSEDTTAQTPAIYAGL